MNAHTIVTVQGGKGKTVDVTRWNETSQRHEVEKTEELPQAGGGNLAQYQLDEGQALQIYQAFTVEGHWVWLTPAEKNIITSMRETAARVAADAAR